MDTFKIKACLILTASLGIIFFSSCLKPQSFPNEPALEFQSFTMLGDSAVVSVRFTDGDGDIGLGDADTIDPFDAESIYHYNYYLEYYEMMNGTWVKGTQDPAGENFPTADTINFAFRIQNLTPVGQNQTLKGTINVTLEPVFYNVLSNHSDTIMYRISLLDRSLNRSNFVETPMIVR